MLPYCINMLVLCYYYMQQFADPDKMGPDNPIFWPVWGTSWLCSFWLILLEVK
jgi:hypothetical protein